MRWTAYFELVLVTHTRLSSSENTEHYCYLKYQRYLVGKLSIKSFDTFVRPFTDLLRNLLILNYLSKYRILLNVIK